MRTNGHLAPARPIGPVAGGAATRAGTAAATPAATDRRGRREHVGELLRAWRERRRLTQLELSGRAQVSARHISFVETGRSRPTSEMILHLAEHLDVPLRERNTLLLAGGYAPAYPGHRLDEPPMAAVNAAVEAVLAGHHPMPALAVDRHWELVAANDAVGLLVAGASADLLAPPVNVLRLSLHPDGLAARIDNLGEWRSHILDRLRHQADATADAVLADLHAELAGYPPPPADRADRAGRRSAEHRVRPDDAVVVRLRLRAPDGTRLAFFTTTTVFGTPADVTVSELAIESFYPADAATGDYLRAWARQGADTGSER